MKVSEGIDAHLAVIVAEIVWTDYSTNIDDRTNI
jgi:hypothetical protein